MSADSSLPSQQRVEYTEPDGRLVDVHQRTIAGVKVIDYCYVYEARPSFSFEHDEQKRLFILTRADGKTEQFRDLASRHLMVEPNPETGELWPVVKNGKPSFLYLCREERESQRTGPCPLRNIAKA
jgi:hypothetical protein